MFVIFFNLGIDNYEPAEGGIPIRPTETKSTETPCPTGMPEVTYAVVDKAQKRKNRNKRNRGIQSFR